jgi:hypothetical protein
MSETIKEPAAPNQSDADPEIEIITDAEAQTQAAPEKPAPKERELETPAAGDEDLSPRLKARFGELTRKMRHAERLAAEREVQIAQMRGELSQAGVVQNKLAEGQIEALLAQKRDELRKAVTDGDTDAQITATEEIAELKAHKIALASQPAPQAAAPRAEPTPAPIQQWIDDHPWFQWNGGQPNRMDPATDAVITAHERAVRRGINPRDPRYLPFVEKIVSAEFPELFDDGGQDTGHEDEPVRKPPPKAAAPQAQIRRAPVSPSPAAPQRIRMTAEQVEHAKIAGVTPQQYMAALQQRQRG